MKDGEGAKGRRGRGERWSRRLGGNGSKEAISRETKVKNETGQNRKEVVIQIK